MTLPSLVLVLLVCAHASAVNNHKDSQHHHSVRNHKLTRRVELPAGCLYDGRWHADGALVGTREACLHCACVRGALTCRRHACAPLPEPPPHCQIVHRREECCPVLQCPNGVKRLEFEGLGRHDDFGHLEPIGHACVEGGTVYAAGSAMSSNVACEQCFCLGGARRCVRPQCLPPPEGCQPQPASGVCCPQRYYCHHSATPSHLSNSHDCRTRNGLWVPEGDRVSSQDLGEECVQCFCLRGSIRCQSLSCAPTLKGCTPLVLPGQCCPHQYQCSHKNDTKLLDTYSKRGNLLAPLNENRSFHTSKSTKRETTIKVMSSVIKRDPTAMTTTSKPTTATEVKKVENSTSINQIRSELEAVTNKYEQANNTLRSLDQEEFVTTKLYTTSTEESTSIDDSSESTSTEQPEKSIKIIVNGTVNCTTELSSSTLLLNTTNINDTVWIKSDVHPRIPLVNKGDIEAHTTVASEIITNRVYNEGFDENDTFIINVTSSLHTNTNSSQRTTTTATSTTTRPKTVPPVLVDGFNASKLKKEELDYDYADPTLPPSLPNLKIIPFVAADAVVDDEISPKESPSFGPLEREDRFPVYYPGLDTQESSYPNHIHESQYNSPEYPVFVSKKDELQNFPSLSENNDIVTVSKPNATEDLGSNVREFTVAISLSKGLENQQNIENKIQNIPLQENRIPSVNLFSPPTETEGGFIPKSPAVVDNFYSLYSSTAPGPLIPHLTTSMPIESKEECISSDGQRIAEGASISMACSVCTCAWGELHCSPRPCTPPPGCRWRSVNIHAVDICCGDLICDNDNTTAPGAYQVNSKSNSSVNFNNGSHNENIMNVNLVATTFDKEFQKEIENTKNNSIVWNTAQAENTIQTTLAPVSDTGHSNTTNVEGNHENNSQIEYEDDEEDEGFSLGNMLELLLSDNYETKTTVLPTTRTSTRVPDLILKTSTPKVALTTTGKVNSYENHNNFIPMPPLSKPPSKIPSANTITRIDHLLLGESSAIIGPRPYSTSKPQTTRKQFTTKPTQTPYTSKPTTKKELTTESNDINHFVNLGTSNSQLTAFGLGLPKLAGCNIYGQMYRIGGIITELSTPCQECRCTEFGVHCTSLAC